jgi:fermentation-respiration switch protein FrsA (DUF1100 family)
MNTGETRAARFFAKPPGQLADRVDLLQSRYRNCGRLTQRWSATFLAFHGNASNIANRAPTYEFLRDTPAKVLALEYRSYGHREGKPTEAGLYLDAEAAYQYLVNTRRLDPKSIVSFGQSVGTAIAVDLAAHHGVGGVILEAPVPSASRVGADHLLAALLAAGTGSGNGHTTDTIHATTSPTTQPNNTSLTRAAPAWRPPSLE